MKEEGRRRTEKRRERFEECARVGTVVNFVVVVCHLAVETFAEKEERCD